MATVLFTSIALGITLTVGDVVGIAIALAVSVLQGAPRRPFIVKSA